MRIVFAGTPAFAAVALSGLLEAGHDVTLVLAQPTRPAGRGLAPTPGAVQTLAEARDLSIYQPTSLKSADAQERIAAARPDVIVVAAYGLILPQAILEIPPHGAINIHASLLPRWRGAAPIQRAILAGDAVTGISIMQMDAGLDTGPVLLRRSVAIALDDDAQTLQDRLAELGASLVVSALQAMAAGRLKATPQSAEGACYAPKISREETALDWSRDAAALERAVRAFRPVPGASTSIRDVSLKVWRAHVAAARGVAGTVLEAGPHSLRVACGDGALDILELQRAGGRRLQVSEFLRGFAVPPGERLGATR